MIVTLEGVVSQRLSQTAVLELGGVGYEVFLPTPELEVVNEGQTLKLYIFEYLREEAHDLYGFKEVGTKLLFEQLVSVSGVGPKLGLAILSNISADQVRSAIAKEQLEILRSVSGVGERVAGRIVVELRNKVMAASSDHGVAAPGDVAYQALRQLGYSPAAAQAAAASVPPEAKTDQERIKHALKAAAQ